MPVEVHQPLHDDFVGKQAVEIGVLARRQKDLILVFIKVRIEVRHRFHLFALISIQENQCRKRASLIEAERSDLSKTAGRSEIGMMKAVVQKRSKTPKCRLRTGNTEHRNG